MWSLVTEYLLLENDELEIKDFGKFTASNYPAKINQETNKIIPAGRQLSFVSIAENTTADFITFLTKKLKINRPEALKLIETKTEEARKKLSEGEKVILPQVGYLFSPDRQKITLVQTTNFSLHPENFGFGEIPIPPKKTPEQPQATEKTAKKTRKVKEKVRQKAVSAKKTVKKVKKVNWAAIVRSVFILAAISAVIILMILFYKPIVEFAKDIITSQKDTEKVATQKPVPVTQKAKPVQAQPAQPKQQAETTKVATTSQVQKQQQAKQDSEIISSFSVKASIPLGTGYKKYYPIVGSFIKRENAEKFRQQLLSEGFSGAVILSAGPNRHRVSIGGYDTLTQVAKARDQYLAKHPGAGIWLLINQPNGN